MPLLKPREWSLIQSALPIFAAFQPSLTRDSHMRSLTWSDVSCNQQKCEQEASRGNKGAALQPTDLTDVSKP